MARILGVDDYAGVKEVWVQDGDQIGIHLSQDIQPLLDRIAAENADGGVPMNEGVGGLRFEFPVELIFEHALERGIPYERVAFERSPEMLKEWKLMEQKWSKLSIERKSKYFGVTQ